MNAPVAHAPSQPSLLPPAARAQVDEANRLIRELNTAPTEPQPAQPVAPARPEWRPATPQPSNAAPGVPEPAPPPSAAAVVAAVAASEPQPQDEEVRRLRAAYSTLQGKYNTEVAGLRAAQQQSSELLNQLVRERNTAPSPAPATPKTPEQVLRDLGATDKDLEDYGEILPIVAKLAENMFKPTMAKLESQVAMLQRQAGSLGTELVKTRQQTLEDDLDNVVPNWRFINESPEFLDWLDVFDIIAGTTRRVALASAYKNLEAQRVVGIFQAYVREYPAAATASSAPPVAADTLIAPTSRGGPAPAPEGAVSKRIISESEIRDFYTRVRKKQVSAEEYERFDAELSMATREGRVRPDRVDHHLNGR